MYTQCRRCIMDNVADETITFDKNGYCNYCRTAEEQQATTYFPNDQGTQKLHALLSTIIKEGRGKRYDCIMGISGGLDSSYLAYLGHKWGLRVLAVHIDDGYDTDISKENIRKLIQKTGFDYRVIKPDSEQFNALEKAYLLAGVPNIAAPQDNVLFAFLYKCMRENHIKYFLSGGNYALECILQKGNTHDASDVINIKDIHRKFGSESIDKLEFISTIRKAFDQTVLQIKSPRPLDLIDYNRERAFSELNDFCGFQYYGRKHLENVFTAFTQLYWFPKKFGVDKRKSHLSSMIMSGQMTREAALKEMEEPLFDSTMEEYLRIIKSNLHISDSEFEQIMSADTHQHEEYKTETNTVVYKFLRAVKKTIDRRKVVSK